MARLDAPLAAASILFLAEQRARLQGLRREDAAFTLEQVKLATEVHFDTGCPRPTDIAG